MPLAGTFDVLDFGEVLSLLSRQSATGRLQVRTVSMQGVIWLADGKATAAEVHNSTGGETRHKWRNQIEDICFDALRSPRGSFEFQPEDEVAIPPGPRVRLETVLANGQRRLEMWQEVESVIHSFEAVPRLAEALSSDSLTLSQDRWKVLVAIDGRRNVAALARRLDIELLEFCQLLKPLIEGGAVVLDQPEGWLKSLPKVRLEVGSPGTLDPEAVIDPGGPDEGLAVITSGPTTPTRATGEQRVEAPGPANGSDGAQASNGAGPNGSKPAAAADVAPPSRRLRRRSRSRPGDTRHER